VIREHEERAQRAPQLRTKGSNVTSEPRAGTVSGPADPYARLAELGLTLPEVAAPVAAYVPAVQSGNHVYVSGQLPLADGKLLATGKVGAGVSPENAVELAQRCALNALAAIDALVGLERVAKVVKLTGFVASADGFTGQPAVINGASELFGAVFGEAGRHARSAVGVAELPLGAPVEIELTVELR
jgi:enamine deaminase RidA (YjgF/YER057c/UK114 family)